MDDFLVLLMNNRLMNLSNLLPVYDRLMMFMNNVLMPLVNYVLMVLMNNVLMMFMNYVFVVLLNDSRTLIGVCLYW